MKRDFLEDLNVTIQRNISKSSKRNHSQMVGMKSTVDTDGWYEVCSFNKREKERRLSFSKNYFG